jgi:hypothetical protein
VDEAKEKVLLIAIEYDLCLGEMIERKKNESVQVNSLPINISESEVIASNPALIEHIAEQIRAENPDYVFFVIGDRYRQTVLLDYVAARFNGSGSYFLALNHLYNYFSRQFETTNIYLDVCLSVEPYSDCQVIEDFELKQAELEKGTTSNKDLVKRLLDSQNLCFADDGSSLSGFSLIYNRMHRGACVNPGLVVCLVSYSGSEHFLDEVKKFSTENDDLLPDQSSLHLFHYAGEAVTAKGFSKGTGRIDERYYESTQIFQNSIFSGSRLKRGITCQDLNIEEFRRKRDEKVMLSEDASIHAPHFFLLPSAEMRYFSDLFKDTSVNYIVRHPHKSTGQENREETTPTLKIPLAQKWIGMADKKKFLNLSAPLKPTQYPTKFWIALGFVGLFLLITVGSFLMAGLTTNLQLEFLQTMLKAVAEYIEPLRLLFLVVIASLTGAVISGILAYHASKQATDNSPSAMPDGKPFTNVPVKELTGSGSSPVTQVTGENELLDSHDDFSLQTKNKEASSGLSLRAERSNPCDT